MRAGDLSYEELQARLTRAETILAALRRGEIDLLIGENEPLVVRFKSLLEKERLLAKEDERLAREWQTTFDAMIDAVWILDAEQQIVRSNKAVERIFGCAAQEVVGQHCWDIVHGGSGPIPECPLLQAKQSKRRESMELQFGERWFEVTVDPILDADNHYTGAVHIISDITGRKQMEEAARRNEEKFRLAFQTSPDSINITRLADGRIVEVNDAFPTITGYAKEEAIGRLTSELELWADPNDRNLMVAELREKGVLKDFEFLRKRKDGKILYTVMSAAVITVNGEPHLLSTIRDIHEHKLAEQALSESAARLIEAQRMAKMGDFTWNVETGEVTWSEALFDLLGYDKSEKIDYSRVNLEIHHPDDLARITQWLNDCIASGKTELTPNEYRLIRKDGQVIHIRTQGVIQREAGQATKVFATVQDITERKQAEESLQKSEEKFRNLYENSPFGIVICQMLRNEQGEFNDFIHIEANQSVYVNTGFASNQLINRKASEIVDSTVLTELVELYGRVVSTGKSVHHEQYFEAHDRTLQVTAFHLYDDLFIINVIDVSKRKQAEEALQKSEEKFRSLFEQSPIAIQFYDRAGKLIDANPQTLEIFGIEDKKYILGYDMWSSPKYTPETIESVRSGHPVFIEASLDFEMVKKTNLFPTDKSGIVYLDLYVNPLLRAGDITGHLVQFVDVTERKQAEARERRLLDKQITLNNVALALGANPDLDSVYHIIYENVRGIMDTEDFIISFYDSATKHIRAGYVVSNGNVCDVTGFPPIPLEPEGQGTQSRVIRSGAPLYIDNFRKAMAATQTEYTIDNNGDVINGPPPEEKQAEATNSALFVPMKVKGETIGVMQVQSYQLDAYDQEDIDFLSALGNIAAVAVQSARLFENLQRANEELQQHRERLQEVVAARTAELKQRVNEVELLNRALNNLLEDLQGSNQNLERTSIRLQAVNKELEDFAYVISHDLKAPLRGISQLASWIIEDYTDVLDEEGKRKLGLLTARTKRMHALIDGVLQYSRIGRVTEQKQAIDLNVLVRDVLDLLSPPAHIHVDVQPDLPTVSGEPTRLTQVFQNLASNAIRFMDKPEGIIQIRCADEETHWQFSVSDNGPGIEQKYYDRIFQLFRTLGTSNDTENTGVGLALVKRIVETGGGRVWVESAVGAGSTFYFTLPKA